MNDTYYVGQQRKTLAGIVITLGAKIGNKRWSWVSDSGKEGASYEWVLSEKSEAL